MDCEYLMSVYKVILCQKTDFFLFLFSRRLEKIVNCLQDEKTEVTHFPGPHLPGQHRSQPLPAGRPGRVRQVGRPRHRQQDDQRRGHQDRRRNQDAAVKTVLVFNVESSVIESHWIDHVGG